MNQQGQKQSANVLERVMKEPLRAWVLAQLNDTPAAAVDLARRSGEPRNKISYHIGKLVEWGCAELIDTVKVRGTEKKIYAAKMRVMLTGEEWERLSHNSRNQISLKILNETVERAQRALESGTFDKRLDRWAANYKPRLDEEGWREAEALMEELHHEFCEELEARSIARNPDPMDRRPFTFSVLLYESPSGH
jgi:hypothetical protein